MTHSAYANLNTPSVKTRQTARLSVGDASADGYQRVEEEDMGDEVEDGVVEEVKESTVTPRKQRAVDSDDKSEASKVARVMAKAMEKPPRFSGETEKEREEVESWTQDVTAWLRTQFSQFTGDYSEDQWTLVQSLLGGTAKRYMSVAKETDPTQTWETMKSGFIEFIRGGRETHSLWMQKMERLTYGRDKCRDLLSLEKEFEQLRVKLYPSSSYDPAMNAVVGRLYGAAIERGDLLLAAEMQRILAVHPDQPTLSQWKNAAVKGAQIRKLATTATGRGGGRDQSRWGSYTSSGEARTPGEKVNELSGDGDDESEADDPGSAQLQQLQGRKGSSRTSGKSGFRLPDEVYRRVMEKRLCLQCYKPGHRINDAACKEKGQKKRMPTEQELNA